MISAANLPNINFALNKSLSVVNFFGGSGVGKSTVAALLYGQMKIQNFKVELIHEVAKDYVWERMHHMFTEQDMILAEQHRLIRRLVGHDIDYAVVDSSILLGLFYRPDWYPKSFDQFLVDVFNTYDNINIFLERNSSIQYVQAGRNQNEQEAIVKDNLIRDYFDLHNIEYHVVPAGNNAVNVCMEIINQHKLIK